MGVTKTEIEFPGYDGACTLRGTVYVPDGVAGPVPAVVASHGMADVASRLDIVAGMMADAGFGVLVYDHRNFGRSDGPEPQEVDPAAQVRDMQMAITVAQTVSGFDPERIGLWGTSFSGAHVLALAAQDRRAKAVVAQVPWLSGSANLERMPAEAVQALTDLMHADQRGLLEGKKPQHIALGRRSDDTSQEPSVFRNDAGYHYLFDGPGAPHPTWRNEITLRSLGFVMDYDVVRYASRISPTPLLMVVAEEDDTTPISLSRTFFDAVGGPKELTVLPGGHYDVYWPGKTLEAGMAAATTWFQRYL